MVVVTMCARERVSGGDWGWGEKGESEITVGREERNGEGRKRGCISKIFDRGIDTSPDR